MDQSIIILSDDEDVNENGFRKKLGQLDVLQGEMNKENLGCSIRDEKDGDDGELAQSCSRLFDDESDRLDLVGLNDAAFLDLVSSDDESNVSHEKPRSILDEMRECEDFANWYDHESFSQPAQSSPVFKELQPNVNELLNSPLKRASISIERSVSDGICLNRKRRKRTKEEIIAEQAAKEEARKRKKQEKLEIKMYEEFCIFSMDARHYDQFETAEEIAAFVENCLKNFPFPSPQLTLVVYGFLKSQKEKVVDLSMEVFERFRAQTRFVITPEEYALFIAQMHRSIARNKRRLEEQVLPIVNIEKGITEGHHSAIISDWWMKMLSQLHRMGSDAQRTIVKTFPNPHVLSKLLRSIPMKDGMEMLAGTKMESGKRIGPVLARKIYLMLTSINGTEIIDES